jgi:hypothetical protein
VVFCNVTCIGLLPVVSHTHYRRRPPDDEQKSVKAIAILDAGQSSGQLICGAITEKQEPVLAEGQTVVHKKRCKKTLHLFLWLMVFEKKAQ